MITFEHTIPETTTSKVYQTIEEWLRSQNAKVKQSQSPVFIEASHGRGLQPMGWKKDAKKTIIFNIAQQDRNVLVRAELKPAALNASDVRSRIDQARANWNELLSDLWYRLGDTVNPPVDWEISLKRGKEKIYVGIILTAVGILASIILSSILGIVVIGLVVVGILSIINGAMNAISARKRLAQQRQAQ